LAELRSAVNLVNARLSVSFVRELICVPSVPNGFTDVWFAQWNGPATEFDNEHGPLIFVQATGLREFIVREMTASIAVAADGSGGEREGLPGVPHVVKAVSICPLTILPRLA